MNRNQQLCIECQECCKYMSFTITAGNPRLATKYRKFYKQRGCNIVNVGKDRLTIMIPKDCPNLTVFGCKIYDTRPQLCREYDGRLDPLIKDKCKWNLI